MDFANVVTWVIVGAIAGQLVGFLVTGKREGMGWFKNLMLGLAGGFLGGFLFIYLLGLDFGVGEFTIGLPQIIAAVLGTFIVLLSSKFLFKKKAPAE